jgi:uncharacterized protein YbjT (DUF2867 family)
MPVVVTGASGLIGRRAVVALARASPQVRAYVRRPEAAEDLRALGAKVAVGPISDEPTLRVVMSGAHTVCHLAGGLNPGSGQTYEQAILGTLLPVIRAAERAEVRRFLYLSYPGASPGSANPYLAAKGQAEAALEATSFERVVIRCTLVYGPGSAWLASMVRQARRRPSFMVGSGSQVYAPVFVDDVAAVLAAADDRGHETSGVWGLEGPDRVTADGFADLAGGAHRRRWHLRPKAIALMARLGREPVDVPTLEVLAADSLADAPDASTEFGVTRTMLRDGLARSSAEHASTGPE